MIEAIVENGKVTNVIEGHIEGSIECGDGVTFGYDYDGVTFTAPIPDPLSIDEERIAKCAEMMAAYGSALASGYTTNSILMDAYEPNIARLKLGYDLAILKTESTMSLTDYDNLVHSSVPVADVLAMVIDLGTNARVQYDNWTAKREYINDAARTISEIQAVTW